VRHEQVFGEAARGARELFKGTALFMCDTTRRECGRPLALDTDHAISMGQQVSTFNPADSPCTPRALPIQQETGLVLFLTVASYHPTAHSETLDCPIWRLGRAFPPFCLKAIRAVPFDKSPRAGRWPPNSKMGLNLYLTDARWTLRYEAIKVQGRNTTRRRRDEATRLRNPLCNAQAD